ESGIFDGLRNSYNIIYSGMLTKNSKAKGLNTLIIGIRPLNIGVFRTSATYSPRKSRRHYHEEVTK
ncbi:MAG: hypothetical protein V1729_05600, partial [Candidatus Woesearchaeota archaeon]